MYTIQRSNRLFARHGVGQRDHGIVSHRDLDTLDRCVGISTRKRGIEGYIGVRIRRHEEHAFNREVTDYFFWLGNN